MGADRGLDIDFSLPSLRRILALSALLIVAWQAPPAAADWGKDADIDQVSIGESNGENPQVAIAENGSGVVVYRDDGNRIEAGFRSRSGFFTNYQVISTGSNAGAHVRLKMNKRGDAIAVWETSDGTGIRSAYKPYNATQFGPEQVINNDPAYGYVEPEVGIDGVGNALVLFHRRPLPYGVDPRTAGHQWSDYYRMSRPAGAASTWGDFDLTYVSTFYPEISGTQTYASVSVSEGGDQMFAFAEKHWYDDGPGGNPAPTPTSQVMRIYTRPAGQQSFTLRTYAAPPPEAEIRAIQATYGAGGEQLLWSQGNYLMGATNIVESQGGPVVDFAGPNPWDLTAGQDAAGNTIGLWSIGGALRSTYSANGTNTFTPPPGDSAAIPGTNTGRTRPYLATGRSSQVAAVFQQGDSNGDTAAWGALRSPGQTTKFAAPTRLSLPGDLEPDSPGAPNYKAGTGPKVALNSIGEGIAVWSIHDGANYEIQARYLTPPGIVPPTNPPPRRQPPVPSAIQPARPIKRNQAIVLKATVAGDVSELRWSFGQKDEPEIVGKVVNGKLQDTVRLRAPRSTFVAKVTAVGPGGAQTYSRSFGAPGAITAKASSKRAKRPRARQSSDASKVISKLKKLSDAPVFAVGNAPNLTAQSGDCSPTTVISGKQTMSGCFKPVEELADIPSAERGAIQALADRLGIDETDKSLMQQATKLTDGYVTKGQALINEEFPVTPSGAASVVSYPQASTLLSANASLPVGGASFDPKNGFNLKLDPKKAEIPLGKLPKPPKLPSLAGLEVTGDWNVDLAKGEAIINAQVKFPEAIKKAGVSLAGGVQLRATKDRVILDSVTVGPIDVNVGGLKVEKFLVRYTRADDEWFGQGKACVIGTACLDMIPPKGLVRIKNGTLAYAGATLDFPPPGIPLFSGVNLENVSFGMGLKPTRIMGGGRVGVAKVIKIDGRLLLAFPTSEHAFILDRREVGDAYPPQLYGQAFSGPTIGASAEVLLAVPVVGELKLARGYLLYSAPGYVALGGGVDLNLIDLFSVRGGVDAEANVLDQSFNVHGEINACIHLIGDLCGHAVGNISRGPGGTGGAGACVGVAGLSMGGGIQWQRVTEPFIWPLDGCKWSRFAIQVRRSRARSAQALAPQTVTITRNQPSQAVQLNGAGAAPIVRVSGPSGTLDSVASQGFAKTPDAKLRILRYHGKLGSIAVVGFQNAKPGTYTIQPLPGSAPVTRISKAIDPPAAKVTGKVTGKGSRRVLRWKARKRSGQKITFQEVARGGAAKTIGVVSASRGRLRFNSAPGRGRRQIVAQFQLAGMNAERKVVTSFRPLSPALPKVRKLKVRRKGQRLLISWKRVKGATRYEVAATLSSRRQRFGATKRNKLTLRRVPRYLSGRVTVRAIAPLREGKLATRRFKRTARRPSPFRKFTRCKVSKKKISCGKGSKKKKSKKRRRRKK